MHPTTPQAPPATHPLLALADEIDLVFAAMLRALGLTQHLFPSLAWPLWRCLTRANARICALLRRVAAGTYRASRPRPGRPSRGGKPPEPIPRRRGWLAHTAGWRMNAAASPLRSLFTRPAYAPAIAAMPPQARRSLGRFLRTPLRLLVIPLPPTLEPAGPPRPPRRRPRAPQPPPEPRREGKCPRFNANRYSPGRIPPPKNGAP